MFGSSPPCREKENIRQCAAVGVCSANTHTQKKKKKEEEAIAQMLPPNPFTVAAASS
jgi:hypothetical protein